MRVIFAAFVAILLVSFASSADAASRHHHYRSNATGHVSRAYSHDGRPRAWCGWYMRQVKGVADPSFNLAIRWAAWGHATSAHPGAVAVWRHHVGEVAAGECPAGRIMLHSGNDGNAVRTRCVSTRGVVAFRDGGGSEMFGAFAYNDRTTDHRPSRQEAYLQRHHYAGADTLARPDYH